MLNLIVALSVLFSSNVICDCLNAPRFIAIVAGFLALMLLNTLPFVSDIVVSVVNIIALAIIFTGTIQTSPFITVIIIVGTIISVFLSFSFFKAMKN